VRFRVYIAMSLDGYIATPDGAVDWLEPFFDEDYGYESFVRDISCVVMGRLTYESVGRPLPRRLNIVVSRSPGFRPEGCVVVPSLAAAFEEARRRQQTRCFVVGGSQLYAEAIPQCERLYLTRVDAWTDGDVYFPDALPEDSNEWRLVSETPHPEDARHAYAFRIQEWQRIRAAGGGRATAATR